MVPHGPFLHMANPTFSYDELASDLGTATADGFRNVANSAANFLCNIYETDPLGVTGFPDPTGVGAFSNGLLSRLCAPRGQLPPPPEPQFDGGQCPIRYNVSIRYQYTGVPQTDVILTNVLGPIVGVRSFPEPSGNTVWGVQAAPDPPTWPDGFRPQISVEPLTKNSVQFNIINIVPVSGTDDCGDPSPEYPVNPTNPDIYGGPQTVNFGNDFSLTVPVVLIPVDIDFDLTPTIEFNVGVGPFNVIFAPDGIYINPGGGGGGGGGPLPPPNLDPRPDPPDPVPPANPGDCDLTPVLDELDAIQEKLEEMDDKLDDIKECACEPEYVGVVDPLGSGGSGTFSLPPKTVGVIVDCTVIGARTPGEYGGGGAPDVVYVGWYAFGRNGVSGDRRPLSYDINYLIAPPDANHFTYTMKYGSEASVSVEYLVEAP